MGFMDFLKGREEQVAPDEEVRPEFVAQVENPTTGEITTLLADSEDELEEKIAAFGEDDDEPALAGLGDDDL